MREQLVRKDPLLRTNKNSVFELLTREEVNKETQALRDQVKTYQEAIRERDQIVKDRDEEISGLKASGTMLLSTFPIAKLSDSFLLFSG